MSITLVLSITLLFFLESAPISRIPVQLHPLPLFVPPNAEKIPEVDENFMQSITLVSLELAPDDPALGRSWGAGQEGSSRGFLSISVRFFSRAV